LYLQAPTGDCSPCTVIQRGVKPGDKTYVGYHCTAPPHSAPPTDLSIMASQRPDLLNLASNRLPIHLPWFPKVVSLGTTLHSSRFHSDNPFSDVSPFEQRSLRGPRFNLEVRHGAVGSFVSATTVKHSEKGEHMTLSLGISIDCLFAGASVTGQYEKETHNNNKVCPDLLLCTSPCLQRLAAPSLAKLLTTRR